MRAVRFKCDNDGREGFTLSHGEGKVVMIYDDGEILEEENLGPSPMMKRLIGMSLQERKEFLSGIAANSTPPRRLDREDVETLRGWFAERMNKNGIAPESLRKAEQRLTELEARSRELGKEDETADFSFAMAMTQIALEIWCGKVVKEP